MEKKKINPMLVALVILALALAVGVIYFAKKSSEKDNQMKEMVEAMNFEKQQLEKEYSEIAVEFDGYTMNIKNDSLLHLFNQEKMKVTQLLDELKSTKVTNAKRITELKQQLSNARRIMIKYVSQIDSLNTLNKSLTKENIDVKNQYYSAAHTNELLEMEKSSLQETVSKAAVMNISNFSVTPLDAKNRRTDRNGRTKNLQLNYTISKNVTTKSGLKTVYLQLINPNGELMSKSPDAFFVYNNKEIGYSISKDFSYGSDNQNDVMFWQVEQPLPTGTYKANFFIDGNRVGSYTFSLDKK